MPTENKCIQWSSKLGPTKLHPDVPAATLSFKPITLGIGVGQFVLNGVGLNQLESFQHLCVVPRAAGQTRCSKNAPARVEMLTAPSPYRTKSHSFLQRIRCPIPADSTSVASAALPYIWASTRRVQEWRLL
jgi:hypothetical protein